VPDWTPQVPHPEVPKRYVWDECLYGFTAHRLLLRDPLGTELPERLSSRTSDPTPAAEIRA